MKTKIIEELLFKDLEYIYITEKQKAKMLLKLQKLADSKKLKKLYEKDIKLNKKHISQIEKIFKLDGKILKKKESVGTMGLISEGNQIIKKKKKFDPEVFDYLLITYTQRLLHYEIVTFNSLMLYARELGRRDILSLLQRISFDIKHSDLVLTDIMVTKLHKDK